MLKSGLGSIYGCLKEACPNSFVTMKANLGSVLSSRPRSRRKSYCVMLNTAEEEFRHRTSVLLRKECYLPSCVARSARICGRKTKLLSCVAQAAMICGRKTNFTSCVARPAMICCRKTKLLSCVAQAAMICGGKTNFTNCVGRSIWVREINLGHGEICEASQVQVCG